MTPRATVKSWLDVDVQTVDPAGTSPDKGDGQAPDNLHFADLPSKAAMALGRSYRRLIQTDGEEAPVEMEFADASPDDHKDSIEVGSSSVAGTTTNLVTAMIGASILGLPAVFSRTGLLLGIPMLALSCAISVYLCNVLAEAIGVVQLRSRQRVNKLDDLALECFGSAGERGTRLLLNTYLVAKTALYLVLIAQNMNYLFPAVPYRGWVLLATGVAFPLAFMRDMSRIERLSILGVVASCFYALCIVSGAVVASAKPARVFEVQPSFAGSSDFFGTLFSTLTMMVFGFGPTDMVTTFRREMREPERLLESLVQSHVLVMVIYLSAGALGFWGFGLMVTGNVNLSMCDDPGCPGQKGVPEGHAGGKWISGVVLAAAVIMNLAVSIPLILFCLFTGVEASYPPHSPMKQLPNATMRIGAVVLSSIVGLCVPFFLHVVAVISSALAMPIVFLIPLAISWKVSCDSGARHAGRRLALDAVVLIIGALAFVVGLSEAVADLIKVIQEEPEKADIFANFWH